jgi:hypothetical protein
MSLIFLLCDNGFGVQWGLYDPHLQEPNWPLRECLVPYNFPTAGFCSFRVRI